jgi:hypothetical protein
MKRKRGRPQSVLARMKGKERAEIRNAIKYGSPAWRIIRLREMLNVQGLPDNYLSTQLARFNERTAAHVRERETIFRKHRTHEARCCALRKMRHKPPIALLVLAVLWREVLAEFERALVRGDDESLHELAKALCGEVSPESRAQFTLKVLDLYERVLWSRMPPDVDLRVTPLEEIVDVTASDIFKRLKIEQTPDGLLVEKCRFEHRERVMEAIHGIEKQIGFALARMNKPLRHE